jgi:mannose-6-phosphate isomerase-like protein (cupin superfamily)
MGVAADRHNGTPQGEEALAARMRAEGLSPHSWGNALGDTYGWHDHSYEKILYCVRGRIVFHTRTGDIELSPGDQMVLPPHTPHAATVRAEGVHCIEAARQGQASWTKHIAA